MLKNKKILLKDVKDDIFCIFAKKVKNGPTASLRGNQSVNIPKKMQFKPPFIPKGGNASYIKDFTVDQIYNGKYIVVFNKMKELKKKVETAIAEQLLEYGFKKKRAGCIVCQKSSDLIYTINFGYTSFEDTNALLCSIHIGVYHKEIQTNYEKIINFSHWKLGTPIIMYNIGYLMPGLSYKEWRFPKQTNENDFNETIADMVSVIKQYAFPIYERLSDIDNLIEELYTNYSNGLEAELIPVIFYTHGYLDRAWWYIEQSIQKYTKQLSKEELEIYNSTYRDQWDKLPPPDMRRLHCYLKYVEQFKAFLEDKSKTSE